MKSSFLPQEDHANILSTSMSIASICTYMIKFKVLAFSPLHQINLNDKSQSSIPQGTVVVFTAYNTHYNVDLFLVMRYTAGKYTNIHLQDKSVITTLSSADCYENFI